mgnify:CR=1 FL=1
MQELAPLDKARDEDPLYTGPSNSYAFFSYRIRRNLHIVVSMDPSNEMFRSRCEANPALFTRCSVQWLEGWSVKGLQQIAAARLTELVESSPELMKLGRDKLINHMIHIHVSAGWWKGGVAVAWRWGYGLYVLRSSLPNITR